MLKTLKKSLPVVATLSALLLTACPGGNPPTTTDPGTGIASIAGTVTKEDGSKANNATVVLIQRSGGVDSDAQIVRTGNNGDYKFNNIKAGNYRVAFVIQTQQERENKTPIAYNPTGKSGEYFGAITTENFDYDGDSTKSFQVPEFNVGWVSQLSPHNAAIDFDQDTRFQWNAVKTSSAVEYNVLIKDSDDNPFYKSANSSANFFLLNPSTAKGNQGNNVGKSFEKGKTYYYIVNAVFGNSMVKPAIAYGNTSNATFSIK